MKILMVLDREFPPDIRVENEAASLSKQGHQVSIACYTRENRARIEQIKDWKIFRRPITTFIYKSSVGALRFPFYFNFWRKFLKGIIEKHDFDAIHVHDLPLATLGYETAKHHKLKFVLDLHENWPYLLETSEHANTLAAKLLSSHKQWRKYEEDMVQKADRVITVVKEMRERICEKGANPDKVIILSNTYNLNNRFDIKSTEPVKQKVLFYAGGISKHRGLQVVINGIKELARTRKDIVLWIVGSGRYKPELEKLVQKLDLDKMVTLFGHKPFPTMMEMLAKADIAIIPHLRSVQNDCSSPNKLFQYMYFKKAVAVSNCVSVARIVDETESGMVYQYDDPEDFARTINEMFSSDKMNKFGEKGHQAVLDKYNWQESAKTLTELYNTL